MSNQQQPAVNINVVKGNELTRILGTLFVGASVGIGIYMLAQNGLFELAATLATAASFMFVRLMIGQGLIDVKSLTAKGVSQDDFTATRGLLSTAYADFQAWLARSTHLRLAVLAVLYAVAFVLVRQGVQAGLVIFQSLYVCAICGCFFVAVVIAPATVKSMFAKLGGSKKKEVSNDNA